MEYWFLKKHYQSLSIFVKMNFAIYPPLQFPITHYSTIPSFQHSNWGEAPKFMYYRNSCFAVPYRLVIYSRFRWKQGD